MILSQVEAGRKILAETKETLATQSDELSSLQAAHDITRIGFASNTAALHKAEAAAATQQRKAEEAAGAAAASQAAAESLRQRLDAQHAGTSELRCVTQHHITPGIHPLYTFIAAYAPMYTRYTCIYNHIYT